MWGENSYGLRILNIETRAVRTLTTAYDDLPGWSPDGSRILFTRKVDEVNFDIFTIKPDGSDLLRVTSHRAGDGHAVWTWDGRIMWNSGVYGFRDEAALYDNTFQQYGQIFIMNADGSGKRMLTDSRWERFDAAPDTGKVSVVTAAGGDAEPQIAMDGVWPGAIGNPGMPV